MIPPQILRVALFSLALIFISFTGCNSSGGDDNVTSSDGNGLPAPIVIATPVTPSGGGGGGGGPVTATATFAPTSPATVIAGGADLVVTVTGSPAGGTISLSNIVTGGTGGTFILGPGALDFTFTTSSATTAGTATVSVTYTPPAPDLPVTVTYTVTVTAPAVVLYATAITGIAGGVGSGTTNGVNMADLYTIDPTTGVATLVGSTGLIAVSDIEYANGTLYAVTSGEGTASLYTLNTATGAATLVAALGTCNYLSGLAFDTSTSTMYAYGESGTCPGDIVVLNLTTGAETFVGALSDGYGGLAYSSTSDILYYLNNSTEELQTVDRATGAKTVVATFSGGMVDPSTGSVHPTTNVLYAAGDYVSNLYTVDTTTAVTTLLSAPGIGFIDGLAFGN